MSFKMVPTKKIYCQNVFVTESHGVYYFTTFVSSPVLLQRQDWALHLI